MPDAEPGYFQRWRQLSSAARLYLLHAALLTSSLAISSLYFNLLILALDYPRQFLGELNTVALGVAAILSLPLWWLVTRIGLRQALFASALCQAVSAFVFAWWPTPVPLLIGVALTGVAAVLFQVSAPPFMMQHSDPAARDHLFSANAAINIGLAGVGSLLAGFLPALFARLLGTGPESAVAYRATFAVAGVGLALSVVPLLLIRRHEQVVPKQAVEQSRQPDSVPQKSVRQTFRRRDLLERIPDSWRLLARHPWPLVRLLIPPFLISWGAALLIPYLNLFFKERFAIPDQVLGQIFAALGVTTGFAALIGPIMSRRIGKIGTVALTQILSIPFLLLLGFMPVLYIAVGAALMRAALFNAGSPLYDAFAMERTEERARPLVIGLINGSYSVGYLVAPQISTYVQAHYGFEPLFVITAICYTLAAASNYWLFVRPERARHPKHT